VSAVARGERKGGVDASRGALGKSDADVGWMRRDEVGGGIQPDVAIDGALGADKASRRDAQAVLHRMLATSVVPSSRRRSAGSSPLMRHLCSFAPIRDIVAVVRRPRAPSTGVLPCTSVSVTP
jgi:hypothetical protein